MPNTKMIIDTSIWIDYFRRIESTSASLLEEFLDENRVVVVGVVLAELIQGARTNNEKNLIKQKLSGLPYEEIQYNHWIKTGELSYDLRKQGITLPLSDLVIAALALEKNWAIFTLDPHFNNIKGLKIYPAER